MQAHDRERERDEHTPISASHTTHNHHTAIRPILGRRIRIPALGRQLGHGRRGILERQEGRHAVGLETPLHVRRGCGVDGGRPQQARAADPDVETAAGVEHFVDEGEGVLLVGEVERVRDYPGVGVFVVDARGVEGEVFGLETGAG